MYRHGAFAGTGVRDDSETDLLSLVLQIADSEDIVHTQRFFLICQIFPYPAFYIPGDFPNGALAFDPALLHEKDLIRDKFHIGDDMSGQDDDPSFGQRTDDIAEADPFFGIKP